MTTHLNSSTLLPRKPPTIRLHATNVPSELDDNNFKGLVGRVGKCTFAKRFKDGTGIINVCADDTAATLLENGLNYRNTLISFHDDQPKPLKSTTPLLCTIQTLPPHLLQCVATLLSPIDVLALFFTNKTISATLGYTFANSVLGRYYSDGNLVLYTAAQQQPHMIRVLVAEGADVTFCNSRCLFRCVNHYASSSVIITLLEGGADPNAVDENGRSVLERALENDAYFSIRELLRYGADKNVNGGAAMVMARDMEDQDFFELLSGWGEEESEEEDGGEYFESGSDEEEDGEEDAEDLADFGSEGEEGEEGEGEEEHVESGEERDGERVGVDAGESDGDAEEGGQEEV
ncbi:hypothetical protein HDV00_010666 [Rhizophlyctis rosea]|nr:hypothetical protein HDV00_010666 [Rhizophlyctis rosea]